MIYYIYEATKYNQAEQKNALSKARDDINKIFSALGAKPINLSEGKNNTYQNTSCCSPIFCYRELRRKLSILQPRDTIFIQSPTFFNSLLASNCIKELSKKEISTILIVHDLEWLRKKPIHDKFDYLIQGKWPLKAASKIVVHNLKMKEIVRKIGVSDERIVLLKIFDYLIPDYDERKMNQKYNHKNGPIIIAGNLDRKKAGYLGSLPENPIFHLYGAGYDEKKLGHVQYFGAFLPNELPFQLSGSFGLVWDGNSSETCSGIHGDYLKINNPHKMSLYLASNLPVVTWKQAAQADFVLENNCGFTVDSLHEIADVIAHMTNAQYDVMKKNAERIGAELRRGTYTKRAINQCINEAKWTVKDE